MVGEPLQNAACSVFLFCPAEQNPRPWAVGSTGHIFLDHDVTKSNEKCVVFTFLDLNPGRNREDMQMHFPVRGYIPQGENQIPSLALFLGAYQPFDVTASRNPQNGIDFPADGTLLRPSTF